MVFDQFLMSSSAPYESRSDNCSTELGKVCVEGKVVNFHLVSDEVVFCKNRIVWCL
jgi:hypothetical protein